MSPELHETVDRLMERSQTMATAALTNIMAAKAVPYDMAPEGFRKTLAEQIAGTFKEGVRGCQATAMILEYIHNTDLTEEQLTMAAEIVSRIKYAFDDEDQKP